jgi:hypothetical protein
VGSTATTGEQAGTDISGRPMAPSLFITDISNNSNNRSGDWQFGGTAIAPSGVFGTWKPFTRTVDYTTSTPTITVTPPSDPAKNNWSLGAGSDSTPTVLSNEGYGAEIRWSLSDLQNQGLILPGHTYRFYVIVHDGDQNKVGGDAGQAAFDYFFPGVISNAPASIGGNVTNFAFPRPPITGATLTLTGIDNQNNSVTVTTTTDSNGVYLFMNVAPGTYTITETAPPPPPFFTFTGATSSVGTITTSDGNTNAGTGTASGLTITSITLNGGDSGLEYDFVDRYDIE